MSRKKYRVQRPLQGQLHDNISDRSQVREHLNLCYFCTTTSLTDSSCSHLAVTLLSLRDISPVRGISVCGAKQKDRTMCGLFVSVGTSAQFSCLRHRIAVTERGCYLSQTKQSGELFCHSDTMRQRQLPTTYQSHRFELLVPRSHPFVTP